MIFGFKNNNSYSNKIGKYSFSNQAYNNLRKKAEGLDGEIYNLSNYDKKILEKIVNENRGNYPCILKDLEQKLKLAKQGKILFFSKRRGDYGVCRHCYHILRDQYLKNYHRSKLLKHQINIKIKTLDPEDENYDQKIKELKKLISLLNTIKYWPEMHEPGIYQRENSKIENIIFTVNKKIKKQTNNFKE